MKWNRAPGGTRRKQIASHVRNVPTIPIRLSEINVDPTVRTDANYINLYQKLLLGKINCALTRICSDEIACGFYQRENGANIPISDIKVNFVNTSASQIRRGHRPVIDVYWSPLAPNGGSYVCPDDQISLAAYKELGIRFVPCRIISPIACNNREGAIWVESKGNLVHYVKLIPSSFDSYPIISVEPLQSFFDTTSFFIRKCHATCNIVVEFHQNTDLPLHYHQMLFAQTKRHARLLDSITHLIRLGRIEHAEALVRTAYEAFLNFYLDWLSPEFFGPRLQLLSAIKNGQLNGNHDFSEQAKVLTNFISLFENAHEKSRLSPLGIKFYESVYSRLSLVTHQSYVHMEREASSFDEYEDEDQEPRLKHISLWINIITTVLLERILNEVGRNINEI